MSPEHNYCLSTGAPRIQKILRRHVFFLCSYASYIRIYFFAHKIATNNNSRGVKKKNRTDIKWIEFFKTACVLSARESMRGGGNNIYFYSTSCSATFAHCPLYEGADNLSLYILTYTYNIYHWYEHYLSVRAGEVHKNRKIGVSYQKKLSSIRARPSDLWKLYFIFFDTIIWLPKMYKSPFLKILNKNVMVWQIFLYLYIFIILTAATGWRF